MFDKLFVTVLITIGFFIQSENISFSKETQSVESKNDTEDSARLDFLVGSYELIGREPNDGRSYYGKMIIQRKDNVLVIKKIINGKTINGVGYLRNALCCDSVKTLIIEYSISGIEYESSYLIDTDLDNYARMTGYVYRKKGDTKKPGLEALFIANSE